MPQYCFHFIKGNPLIEDVVVDLSDLDAAKAEGFRPVVTTAVVLRTDSCSY